MVEYCGIMGWMDECHCFKTQIKSLHRAETVEEADRRGPENKEKEVGRINAVSSHGGAET